MTITEVFIIFTIFCVFIFWPLLAFVPKTDRTEEEVNRGAFSSLYG